MALPPVAEKVTTQGNYSCRLEGMKTALMDARLEVRDLEFVPNRPYAAFHACGTIITAEGALMREEMDRHTAGCEYQEPTA